MACFKKAAGKRILQLYEFNDISALHGTSDSYKPSNAPSNAPIASLKKAACKGILQLYDFKYIFALHGTSDSYKPSNAPSNASIDQTSMAPTYYLNDGKPSYVPTY